MLSSESEGVSCLCAQNVARIKNVVWCSTRDLAVVFCLEVFWLYRARAEGVTPFSARHFLLACFALYRARPAGPQ